MTTDTKQTTEQPKATLSQLLARMTDADNDALTFDPEMLRGDVAIKVDDYKAAVTFYEGIAARIADEAATLAAAATAAKNKAARIKELMLFNLKGAGFEKLPGVVWRVQIESRKTLKVVDPALLAPTAKTYLELPEFVERSYSLKTRDLLDAAKADPERFAGRVAESVSEFVKFYPNTAMKATKVKDNGK